MCNTQIPVQEDTDSSSEKDKKLRSLKNMGYPVEEAEIAMERCGAFFPQKFATYVTSVLILLWLIWECSWEKVS